MQNLDWMFWIYNRSKSIKRFQGMVNLLLQQLNFLMPLLTLRVRKLVKEGLESGCSSRSLYSSNITMVLLLLQDEKEQNCDLHFMCVLCLLKGQCMITVASHRIAPASLKQGSYISVWDNKIVTLSFIAKLMVIYRQIIII